MADIQGKPADIDARINELLELLPKTLREEWTMQALADHVGLSPSHLRKLFVANTGLPPMRYLKWLRLTAAEELLSSSFLSVKQIADAVGINDVSHFVRAFRLAHGKVPSAYRKWRRA